MKKLGLLMVVAVALASVAGCSGGRSVKKASVSGKVTLDGEPVEGVEVHFAHPSFNGMGVTRADGTYELVTGAAVGKNTVFFKPVVEVDAGGADEGIDEGQLEAMAGAGTAPPPGIEVQESGVKLPEMYTDPAKASITYDVPPGGTSDANFSLSSK